MKVNIEHSSQDGIWGLRVTGKIVTVSLDDGDNCENRSYDLPEEPEEVEYANASGMPYVWIHFKDTSYYQFKFEDGGNLIGDSFDTTGKHKDTVAMYTFGEEWEVYD
jgi:hypothetical protein